MNKLFAFAALAAALAVPALAAITPKSEVKADRFDVNALRKGDRLPVNGAMEDGSVIIGYQTAANSITLFRVPLLTVAAAH